jgi:hypothetical protein
MIDSIKTTAPAPVGRTIPNFPLLTDAIGGGLRGITAVGGPTKHGKSRFVANLIANVGGPSLPVLYLDRENDDQVDANGEPITRAVGDWIVAGYGEACPALETLYGYHDFDDLKDDVHHFAAPAVIVLDTVQSIVGQAGDQMRTATVALVEWAKTMVRRGYLVVLVSQVNGFGEFKESKALAEGCWTSLMVQRKGTNTVEVRVGHLRRAARIVKGVVLQDDGARMTEVCRLGTTIETEQGVKLTAVQRAVVKVGERAEMSDILKAMNLSTRQGSAERRRGERRVAQADAAGELRRMERGHYALPATDISTDIVSVGHVGMSVIAST